MPVSHHIQNTRNRRVRWRVAFALATAVVLVPLATHAQLPTLGDSHDITTGGERELGEKIARQIYRDPDYSDDAMLTEYVQGIWQPLLAAARARGDVGDEIGQRFAWEVMLNRDRTINAFALPGGYLGVNTGLIAAVTSRDELASVLAHELTHVSQRHIARMITEQGRAAPWMLASMLLGVLAASRSPQAANAMIVGGQAAMVQNQLNFSRDMEREADRIGYGVLTQAGFSPLGFVSMFQKLQQASRINDNGSFPYLRTHPLTTERIADMQARQQLDGDRHPLPPLTMMHAMMAARARMLGYPPVDLLRTWLAEPDGFGFANQPAERQAGALYAATMASMQQRDFGRAQDFWRRLQALASGSPKTQPDAARAVRLLGAELALANGEPSKALPFLNPQARDPIRERAEVMLLAQARTRMDQAAEVAEQMRLWVSLQPRDAVAWQQLVGAYQAQGRPIQAIRAEAEVQVARLDYAAAVDRLKAAQDLGRRSGAGSAPDEYVEMSIIDARLRQVQSLLREQTAKD